MAAIERGGGGGETRARVGHFVRAVDYESMCVFRLPRPKSNNTRGDHQNHEDHGELNIRWQNILNKKNNNHYYHKSTAKVQMPNTHTHTNRHAQFRDASARLGQIFARLLCGRVGRRPLLCGLHLGRAQPLLKGGRRFFRRRRFFYGGGGRVARVLQLLEDSAAERSEKGRQCRITLRVSMRPCNNIS